jgi:hypothetical protein
MTPLAIISAFIIGGTLVLAAVPFIVAAWHKRKISREVHDYMAEPHGDVAGFRLSMWLDDERQA